MSGELNYALRYVRDETTGLIDIPSHLDRTPHSRPSVLRGSRNLREHHHQITAQLGAPAGSMLEFASQQEWPKQASQGRSGQKNAPAGQQRRNVRPCPLFPPGSPLGGATTRPTKRWGSPNSCPHPASGDGLEPRPCQSGHRPPH